MLTALALPPIVLVALGAIQINAVVTDRQMTQDVADSAALWGAQQLTITPVGTDQRTMAFADAQLANIKSNATVAISATVTAAQTIKVTIDTNRPSFFLNLMPAGGFNTHVESIAEGLSQGSLCVLITGPAGSDHIVMGDNSRLQGPQCLVHSNHNVAVSGGALLQADTVEAGGSASGPVSPAARTGAPIIADPFSSLNINFPTPCTTKTAAQKWKNYTLPAGVHCFDIEVNSNGTLTLGPGDHYFGGDLDTKNKASIVGNDVALVFGPGTQRNWDNSGTINLNGRETGSLAGFVLIDSRSDTGLFRLTSDPITNITGTVYVPNATLQIDGSGQAAQASAWTVVAAKALWATGSPSLVINANYTGSSVPVPSGVGNKTVMTHLK